MVRTVKIGDKSYDLKSSAFTMFSYKDITGNNLMSDINLLVKKYTKLKKISKKESKKAEEDEEYEDLSWLSDIMEVVDKVLKMAHIMIKEQNPQFKEYDEWLKELDGLLDNTEWVLNVLEVGMSPFRRGIFNSPIQQ